jgi:hypothetical protein
MDREAVGPVKPAWSSEEALATAVSGWLAADGWECFYEVCEGGGEPRADIVATQGSLVWVVECKLRLGLEVLAQADRWRGRGLAHYVSMAVPKGKRTEGAYFIERIARERGIGLIRVPDPEQVAEGDVYVLGAGTRNERVVPQGWSNWDETSPKLMRKADVSRLRALLTPERKASRPGSRGPYHTPFRETCKLVTEHVREAGGRAVVRDTIHAVKHHYASHRSAIGSLVNLVKKGVVPGIRVEQDGRALLFVLDTSAAPNE